jgi:hypothetical protein
VEASADRRRSAARGVGDGARSALANHCGFVELVAVSATGPTSSCLPPIRRPATVDVIDQEGIGFVIHDDEFADLIATCGAPDSTSPP